MRKYSDALAMFGRVRTIREQLVGDQHVVCYSCVHIRFPFVVKLIFVCFAGCRGGVSRYGPSAYGYARV
jgi:hypothetical protein